MEKLNSQKSSLRRGGFDVEHQAQNYLFENFNFENRLIGKNFFLTPGITKFILVEKDGEKFVVSTHHQYHSLIYKKLCEYDPNIQILGGGSMECLNNHVKEIKLFGFSLQYGKADFSVVKSILNTELSGSYKIRIHNN